MVFNALFLLIGVLHGTFAIRKQVELHPQYNGHLRMLLIYVLAVSLWPIELLIYIKK